MMDNGQVRVALFRHAKRGDELVYEIWFHPSQALGMPLANSPENVLVEWVYLDRDIMRSLLQYHRNEEEGLAYLVRKHWPKAETALRKKLTERHGAAGAALPLREPTIARPPTYWDSGYWPVEWVSSPEI
jgi:hypothetical protein